MAIKVMHLFVGDRECGEPHQILDMLGGIEAFQNNQENLELQKSLEDCRVRFAHAAVSFRGAA
ncbi:hypothetical protein [Novosphingobium album (ex Liu et al. 2023)]|uniref:Uncharacterized protein n=1 Tax=Novosphingobium album (ex Liu et al. 2023) TaxID=3031130 RepID=A0ABT5WQ45_9SPHN|nr:hypothetical protein [Novosphingobium album (ex Liu et al. 2023)]MDE8652140.1 hypothetical protein [Novosphingobium album (ex Liu et al. 2023)]